MPKRNRGSAESMKDNGTRSAEQIPKGQSVSEFVNQNREQDSRRPDEHLDKPNRHVVNRSEMKSRDESGNQPKKGLNARRKTEKTERNILGSGIHRLWKNTSNNDLALSDTVNRRVRCPPHPTHSLPSSMNFSPINCAISRKSSR